MMTQKIASNNLAIGNGVCYQFHPKMGFWGIPNLDFLIKNELKSGELIKITHNSVGNRDREPVFSLKKTKIICFGGSHTWGAGVEQDKRYSNLLERLTEQEVFNFGHCSLGLDQVFLAILESIEKYHPDIIVVEQYPWAVHRVLNNYVNGFIRPYFYLDERKVLNLKKVNKLAKYKIFRRIIGRYYSFRKEFREYQSGINVKHDYDPKTDPIFLYWKARQYDAMYELIHEILSAMANACKQKNVKLIFGLGAIQQQFNEKSCSELVDYDLPRKRLVKLLEANKIPYIDMVRPMLDAHSDANPVIFPDGHINERGHEVFAHSIYDELMQKGWVK